tara:strand:+ start:2001 stop:2315 length:315 start_codon:yes stop_codon:yes gene_type:complete
MAYQNLDVYSIVADSLGISVTSAIGLLAVIWVWSLIWKGIALWKSAGKKQLVWFVVLLIVNTIGILEILYIFVFSKMKWGKSGKEKGKKVEKRGSGVGKKKGRM